MQKRLLLVSIGWLLCSAITGQNLTTRNITLEQAIEIAHARSPQVQMAQLNFMAQYWDFRSYKAWRFSAAQRSKQSEFPVFSTRAFAHPQSLRNRKSQFAAFI